MLLTLPLSSSVTFILGFFNANVYNRWWKMRELMGTVMGRSNDTVLLMSIYIKNAGQDDEHARKAVKELRRYMGLALALLNMAARQEDTVEELDLLCEKKDKDGQLLLQKGSVEYNCLRDCNCGKYNIVYG